jgi:stage II sporulation protein AA (anti-sigma F factor antagonist)
MDEIGIKVTVVDGVVSVSGEIDMNSAKSLDRALAAIEPPRMVDMRAVSFMDSSGLNVLLAHYRCVVGQESAFRVVAMSRAFERVFEVTGLLRTLAEDSTQLL